MASDVAPVSITPLVEHKQLRIIRTPLTTAKDGACHFEYRVYNWRRLSSGRVVRGDGWSLIDLLVTLLLVWLLRYTWRTWLRWQEAVASIRNIAISVVSLLIGILHIHSCLLRVVYQSVIPLPGLGLQLTTTRGISLPHPLHFTSTHHRLLLPLKTSYTFITLSEISTVVINEGLRRWNIRYYLAVIKRHSEGVVVALDAIWAPVSVLGEVYHGVRESLFDEYAEPP